ncbi:TolC family outer membrane protein [Glycocaulis sp.]|uniref:TolC family outer membrane protein n=1 Tax=Glycocaulis sp. TaxID=1969725 RepID=UPI003F6F499A
MKFPIGFMLAAGLGLSGLAAGASAQTLNETLEAAYRTSPVLAAERARLRQASEGVVQARAARLPTLSASAGISDGESWGPGSGAGGSGGDVSYSLSASQSLYSGGSIDASVDQALNRIEASRWNVVSTEQDVILSAIAVHLDVVRDTAIVDIRRNNVDVLAEQLRAARDRFEVGEITRTDVAQAEARVSGAQAQLSAAQATLAASRAGYERVTGVTPLDVEQPESQPDVPETLAIAADVALESNPLLLSALFNEQASQAGIRLARSALRPDVALSASASESRESDFTGRGRGSVTVGARVSMPIFTGGLNESRIRQAVAAADESRLQVLNVRRAVAEGISNAWNSYLAAEAVIISSREAVRANEIAFEGVRQEAFVGLRTTLDVLNAEQELLNSRLELVRAERDYQVAAYALLQAMGRLTAEQVGLEPYEEANAGENRRFWPNFPLTGGN